MVVRIRNPGLVGRILSSRLPILWKKLDMTGALGGPTESFPDPAARVRAACLRHPYIEAPKDYRAYEPKWMKGGLTTLS